MTAANRQVEEHVKKCRRERIVVALDRRGDEQVVDWLNASIGCLPDHEPTATPDKLSEIVAPSPIDRPEHDAESTRRRTTRILDRGLHHGMPEMQDLAFP